MKDPKVSATIVQRGDTVLLLRRGPTAPWMPNKWNYPTGHIEDGESPMQAAERETLEESGITVSNLRHVLTLELPTNTVAYFHTTEFEGEPQIDFESSEWAWVPIDEVGNYDCIPGVNQALASMSVMKIASRKIVLRAKIASRPKIPILWWENEDGDRWVQSHGSEAPPPGYIYQWSRFPTQLREHCLRTVQQDEVDACPHPPELIKKDLGIIDSMEGRECMRCHGYQSKNKGDPWPDKWEAHGSREVMVGVSSWSDDLVIAMIRPNSEELTKAVERFGEEPRLLEMDDAILMAATSCERCLNGLRWRYGLDDGYPPYGTEWDKAGTSCFMCRETDVWDWLLNKPTASVASRVVARYKTKRKVRRQDGKGETTVYEYSDQQVAQRNIEKAKRIEALSKSITNLRKQVFKDLSSEDPKTALTALAVGLMDETYERVGNDQSAEEGHFGVTGWRRKHLSFSNGKATAKYIGKSGVEQEKTISDPALIKALRKAYDEVSGENDCVFFPKSGKVGASDVNAYLRKFKVTAKDIRGFHANDVMRGQLRAVRSGRLPSDPKERERILKNEFKAALEATAAAVGHEPSTLRNQYLVPGMEDSYIKDGTVVVKLNKAADWYEDDKYPLEKLPESMTWGGDTYWCPLQSDTFVHITLKSRAEQIVASHKLLMHPPYEKFGGDAIYAISTVYGKFVSGVQATHLKATKEDPFVAVVFKTNTLPDSGFIEEVSWHKDVDIQEARIVSMSRGLSMIKSSPVEIGDQDMVTYDPKYKPRTASRVVARFIQSEYSQSTLDELMAGIGMLMAQNIIVTNPFFDEKEIRKFIKLRRTYHDQFSKACNDLAEEIEAGQFGSSMSSIAPLLKQVGAVPPKQAQRALRMAARALRSLKRISWRDLPEGSDPRILRLIRMANNLVGKISNDPYAEGPRSPKDFDRFLTDLIKVKAIPAPVRTLLRKALKYQRANYKTGEVRPGETANVGAWFEMSAETQDKLKKILERTLEKRDQIFDEIQDPEERRTAYLKSELQLERIRNAAGVNPQIIAQGATEKVEPLEKVLRRESKLQADGPTEFTIQKIQEKIFKGGEYRHKGEGKGVSREVRKVLTQIGKARTFDTIRRIIQEAVSRNLLESEMAETVEGILSRTSRNLAVRMGVPLVPIQWSPTTEEEFQQRHSTGRVTFTEDTPEEKRQEILGRVSRAVSDLEGIFGQGFAGKHDKPLEFAFTGGGAFAKASYFAYDNPQFWQPRVKFGDEFEGLLAHELSHYFDDLLANKIDKAERPNAMSQVTRDLFGSTGVELEYIATTKRMDSFRKNVPELAEFVEAVLSTPDYARWKDMTSSAHEIAVDRAIKTLTGQSVYDLPRDHPFAKTYWDLPRYRSDWPPELLAETEKQYQNMMQGDTRKLRYYHSGVEVWARMIEQYVYTKLAKTGISNPWLTQMTYDIDVLPQAMDQEVFEEKISPVLDRLFERIKERKLIAKRIVARYLKKAVLKQKHREETDREEWALFDSEGKRVLKWFGEKKPSDEQVLKEERRIQFFKHHAAGNPPSKSQIDYAKHLIKQVGGMEPDWGEMDQVAVSDLIDGLKKKRGKPMWYGNGKFRGWE